MSPFKKLRKALDYAMNTTVEKKYRLDEYLHYSSLPYCALRKMYTTLDKGGFFQYEDMEFGMRYYTSVGTTVHEGIQEYMSMLGADRGLDDGYKKNSLGAVVGNYECQACGSKYPFSTDPFCAKCGAQMEYKELQVKWGKNVIGHCDGLYMYEVKPKRYIVIDYKTTSSKAVWMHLNRGPVFPYKKNVAQIESYLVSLEVQYGITIDGWALIYMPRDNPKDYKAPSQIAGRLVSDRRKEILRRRMRKADRHWPIMLKVESIDDAGMDKLICQKPCKSLESYDRQFGDKYDECPLMKVCFDEDKLRRKLGKMMRENQDLLPLGKNLKDAIE